METHFTSELLCHESYQVHLSNGSSLEEWELATYMVDMLTWLQWQQK